MVAAKTMTKVTRLDRERAAMWDTDPDKGTWYQSYETGIWYRNRLAVADIRANGKAYPG